MQKVYYLCYGSNLSEARFREYLSMHNSFSGQRALESGRLSLPHEIFYAGHSGRWGGGVAYLDVDSLSPQSHEYRVYGMSVAEFEALFSGENGYYSGVFPWGEVLSNKETVVYDALFYDRVVNFGSVQGTPVLTLTTSTRRADMIEKKVAWPRENPPGQKYREVMSVGRKEIQLLPQWSFDAS